MKGEMAPGASHALVGDNTQQGLRAGRPTRTNRHFFMCAVCYFIHGRNSLLLSNILFDLHHSYIIDCLSLYTGRYSP